MYACVIKSIIIMEREGLTAYMTCQMIMYSPMASGKGVNKVCGLVKMHNALVVSIL